MALKHGNLSRAGIPLQYLRSIGWNPSGWATGGKAATCKTKSWSVGSREETIYLHFPTPSKHLLACTKYSVTFMNYYHTKKKKKMNSNIWSGIWSDEPLLLSSVTFSHPSNPYPIKGAQTSRGTRNAVKMARKTMPSPTSSFCSPLSFGCLLPPTPSFKASLCTGSQPFPAAQAKTETAAEARTVKQTWQLLNVMLEYSCLLLVLFIVMYEEEIFWSFSCPVMFYNSRIMACREKEWDAEIWQVITIQRLSQEDTWRDALW